MCSGILRGQHVATLLFEFEKSRTLALVPEVEYDIQCNDDSVNPVWFHNGTRVPDAANATIYQISESPGSKTLKFSSFSADQAGDYTCSKPCGTCIINIIPGNPVVFLSKQSATRKINSAQGIFVFFVLMGDPLPSGDSLTWSHNGAPLGFPNSLGVVTFTNALAINPEFTNDHEGNYTATVTSTVGSGSDSFHLSLQYFPVANLSLESTEGSRFNESYDSHIISLHSSVSIRCYDSLSTDGPLEFTWTKDSLPLNGTGYNYTIQTSQEESTFMFEIVDLTYAGSYQCSIENSVGSNSTKVQIIVAYAPVISKLSPERISWVIGNEGEIQVLFEGAVPEPRVIWTRQQTYASQQKTLLVNGSDFIFSGLHSLNLTLTNVTPADAGIYTVTAFNFVGNVTLLFRVDVLFPPPSPSAIPNGVGSGDIPVLSQPPSSSAIPDGVGSSDIPVPPQPPTPSAIPNGVGSSDIPVQVETGETDAGNGNGRFIIGVTISCLLAIVAVVVVVTLGYMVYRHYEKARSTPSGVKNADLTLLGRN